jgi:hypothetical protein
MKKYLFALLVVMLLSPGLALAVGTCTQAVADKASSTNPTVKTLTFVCTADASAGTYPATAVTDANMAKLYGWTLISGSWLNGATGATANSTVTLSTTAEGDVLGGAGKGPTAATAGLASKFKPLVDTTYLVAGPVPTSGAMTLQVTQAGSAVNSAIATLVFKFIK